MTNADKVTAYLEKHSKWTEQLKELRSLFQQTELIEEVKWGSPTYTLNGKLVAGISAFKNHYAIWFHQGSFLKDTQERLINAQEGTTRGMRQWRFEAGDSIESQLILSYVQEAIENSLAGKEIKPQRKQGVTIPKVLQEALKNNPKLKAAFTELTPGKQREFAYYILAATQEKTKHSRLEKITPMILSKVGLNDQYK